MSTSLLINILMISRIHTLKFLVLCLLPIIALGYQQLDTKKEYLAYLQKASTYPTFQVFYNRHFKKSRQFQDFLEVIEDVEAKIKDYAKIIFTDCDEALGEEFAQCQQIMDNNENRFTLGLKPNSKFLSLSGKLLQRNPSEVKYNHPLDVYTVAEIVEFIQGLVPSYLIDVVSLEEYEEFLKPRYSTKAIYFTKQDEAPLNIKKLSTIFHKRIDFSRVQDLSQEIIAKHNIIHFPTLLVLKYNYTLHKFQQHKYSGPHFDVQGYIKIKSFLQQHASKQPRNDLLFHSIVMQTQNDIVEVNNHDQKDQKLDRMSGMVWIQESATPKYLTELQDKYNAFFNYIHIVNEDSNDTILTLFNTQKNIVLEQTKNQFPNLEFISLDYKSLMSNITFFMQKNYSVMVVPKQYGYFCTITNKLLFQGITNCFIGDTDALVQLKKQTGDFQYGIVAYQTANMDRSRFSGHQIQKSDYETVYRTLEEATKVKLDSQIKNYLQNPVSQISDKTNIFSKCADPRRKCIVAFLDPSKSIAFKAEKGYLKDIGQEYYSDYRVFWLPLSCNRELLDALNEPKATLMIIDPIRGQYQSLKQKITKSILQKFIKLTKVNSKKWKQIKLSQMFNDCLEDPVSEQL